MFLRPRSASHNVRPTVYVASASNSASYEALHASSVRRTYCSPEELTSGVLAAVPMEDGCTARWLARCVRGSGGFAGFLGLGRSWVAMPSVAKHTAKAHDLIRRRDVRRRAREGHDASSAFEERKHAEEKLGPALSALVEREKQSEDKSAPASAIILVAPIHPALTSLHAPGSR